MPDTADEREPAYLTKDHCLERAKELLASGDSAALRYACLELRQCIEAVTYEKLQAYAPWLPAGVLSKWQPPQAIRALVQLEGPEAAEEYTAHFGLQGRPLEIVGEHRTFAARWLEKTYHKLGNFLHVPNRNDPTPKPDTNEPTEESLRSFLLGVVGECERVVESSLTSAVAHRVTFNCQLCGRKAGAHLATAKSRGRTSCLHPACGAEHVVVVESDGSVRFDLPQTMFECPACGQKHVEADKGLEDRKGCDFACEGCGQRYRVVPGWRAFPLPAPATVEE